MSKVKLKATTLRAGLSICVFVLLGLGAIGFYWTYDWLSDLADETRDSMVMISTNPDDDETQVVAQLEEAIASRQEAADKAVDLTISSQNYQSRIIEDINSYAAGTGISITNYDFNSKADKETTSTTVGNGIRTEYVTVALGNPVNFANLLRFIKAIETNVPKMQLTDIKLSRSQSASDSVSVEPLTIEVYVR